MRWWQKGKDVFGIALGLACLVSFVLETEREIFIHFGWLFVAMLTVSAAVVVRAMLAGRRELEARLRKRGTPEAAPPDATLSARPNRRILLTYASSLLSVACYVYGVGGRISLSPLSGLLWAGATLYVVWTIAEYLLSGVDLTPGAIAWRGFFKHQRNYGEVTRIERPSLGTLIIQFRDNRAVRIDAGMGDLPLLEATLRERCRVAGAA